jgi:hypothetical protein
MKNLKKLLFASAFGLSLAFFMNPGEADAGCVGPYFDVTYPSVNCDPMGEGSCTRKCLGEQ